MKKLLVCFSLLLAASVFAADGKVICGVASPYEGANIIEAAADIVNRKIRAAATDGFSNVSGPAISQNSGHEPATVCVTVTKP